MQKFNWNKFSILIYLLINIAALLFGVWFINLVTNQEENLPLEIEEVIVEESIHSRQSVYELKEFSTNNFYSYILEVNMKFPKIVMAQAILESGNFQSNLFIKHNNPFGMTIASKRPTLTLTKNSKFASYKNWQSSVLDYALFQSRFMKAYDTEDKYYKRLGEVYAEDPTYVSKLKKIVNTL